MERNVCGFERIVRAALGIVILLAGLDFGSWLGLIGLIPLLTAVVGYCPLNHAFHYSVCPLRTSP